MAQTKILTAFARYSHANLEQKAELIVDSMTDNEHFPEPTVPIAGLKAAVEDFDAAMIKAKEGSKVDKELRDQKREALITLLDKLALYVQMIGNGNDAILASSGYSLSKEPEHVGILDKPKDFNIHPESGGMIKLRLKALRGAKSYRYEYKKVTNDNWEVVVHTKSNLLLTNLESGQQYHFRVCGVGTAPERVYSDVLSSFIL